METLYKIGCSRRIVFWLQAAELGIVFAIGLGLASVLSLVAVWATPRLLHWL